jgi:L-threonylcarbamoyladenylate synthase
MKIISQFDEARQLLADGKIIAYPTESVYGLGCDPFNQLAVEKIIALKQRPSSKGFIILIADWSQLMPFIGEVPEHRFDVVRATWPGPVTWVFPPAKIIPDWLSGQHNSIAIRMSAHPVARELCAMGPVISTSANISGDTPAIDVAGVRVQFPSGVDAVLTGELGGNTQLSAIYDVLNGRCLR